MKKTIQPKPQPQVRDFNTATSTRTLEKKQELKSLKKAGVIATSAPGFKRF